MTWTRRAKVRMVSFVLAIIAALCGLWIYNAVTAMNLRRSLEYSYLRAVEDLAGAVDNIKTTLSKGMYAGTPAMLSSLSGKLWTDSSSAKNSLGQLPVGDISLQNTNKFLSQVGDYSVSLAKNVSSGNKLTDEEKKNIEALYGYSETLSSELWDLNEKLQNGYISFSKTVGQIQNQSEQQTPTVGEGFKSFEEGFQSYPTLIYDGPFSDHILMKDPILTKDAPPTDRETARQKAAVAAQVDAATLKDDEDEAGKMPSYCFVGENSNISVTKNGCLLSYMLKNRAVGDAALTAEQAIAKATEYLGSLGIEAMLNTYYQVSNNICTINYASRQGDVTVYTDLIKVSVALDNGEILSFDSRGYIVNHVKDRPLGTPQLSAAKAMESVSTNLTAESVKLAVIPSQGLNEVFAYEFSCVDKNGQRVLVYVNANTGKEEQILILMINEGGVLTM